MQALSPSPAILRAAQYVRMSTEHQQYSTGNQSAAIAQYAAAHGMQIVRSFVDAGKSGLKLAGRDALQELIRIVDGGRADFDCILVYDVSRWGRFQDADESAYYEYICKRAGISVHYCAEEFKNDNSTSANLLKALKRTMAGEFSRELSSKVFAGQCHIIELGFRAGGMAGYGLRRQLVDKDGNRKTVLGRGERKSLQTDRVVLVPGPPEEVTVVKEIYRLFVEDQKSQKAIADVLNLRGVLHDSGRKWTKSLIREILTNPKYIGANVYNRSSCKLQKPRSWNPRQLWRWRDGAFEPIIPVEQFLWAQAIAQDRNKSYTDVEMLSCLRHLLACKKSLTGDLINATEGMPSASAYRAHFGRLTRAYTLIGYTQNRFYSGANERIQAAHREELEALVGQLQAAGVRVIPHLAANLLSINDELTVSLTLARCRTRDSAFRWLLRLDGPILPDIVIVGRMGAANRSVMDYYLLPGVELTKRQFLLAPENALSLEVYRVKNLTNLVNVARRVRIEEEP